MNRLQLLKKEINQVRKAIDKLINSEVDICIEKVIELGNKLDSLIQEYSEEEKKIKNGSKTENSP